jgi:hypothetical protein
MMLSIAAAGVLLGTTALAAAIANIAPSLWREPVDISSRNLYYGIGGQENQPCGPYTFVEEDLGGSTPKFDVVDGNGVKWKAKLGIESQSEVAASRFVWAAGYHTPIEYLVPTMQVAGLPEKLHRSKELGKELVGADGTMHNVRFKRQEKGMKNVAIWSWESNPFSGTRELNGLKTLMALINNRELKDVNNAVYNKPGEQIYLVSDLGATFGPSGRGWPQSRAKDDFSFFEQSQFIQSESSDTVDFGSPGRPRWEYAVSPIAFYKRIQMQSITKKVPRTDARWLGELLSRLSADQIRDAFRAAGYQPAEVDGFTAVIEQRIQELKRL